VSRRTVSTAVVLVVLMGCVTISAASATSDRGAFHATSAATVKVGQSRLGPILVDGRGRTLYVFNLDANGNVTCTYKFENCAHDWPPLLTQGKPRAGKGVNPRLLGTVRRTNPAGVQVTYNRHPLYFFSHDKKPGDVKGQGHLSFWWALSPTGKLIKKK
jgi:predicted lipoprotein with Yx(FWY)xxD motif